MMCTMMLAIAAVVPGSMEATFALQPVPQRPRLEVRYTDATRTAFEILARDYHLTGQLRQPHLLLDAASGAEWLNIRVKDAQGKTYDTAHHGKESRINLYRRGPWYCEIRWLDIQVADADGKVAPLKGDLALYCFSDKLLASITWHGVGEFSDAALELGGLTPASFPMQPYKEGVIQTFAFPIFAEPQPLAPAALTTINADEPLRYDATRGLYMLGSFNPGGFEEHFIDYPNYREQVQFTVTNDATPRTIYICHETSSGVPGLVEGGAVLDTEGHPLPMVVQVSKNFAGEKEEAFYNPEDTPFSETFFPLVLAPNESVTLTSVHLYQNWGSHMTKHFSSLGAWMDYFHSSTGVTETTCYVPFNFGGLPGVTIADFRAMSQPTFWKGQPQHDNVAGHSFLSYMDGKDWQYSDYQGTTYTSTGPNFMDIGLEYMSSDRAIHGTVRTFELPQSDELRNFINVRYEILKPLTITNAKENFRILSVSQWVQQLRFTHAAASGLPDAPLTFEKEHFAISGHPLPTENAFLALYGDERGSNAIILRSWKAPFTPAMSVWCKENGDTRLLMTANADTLELKPGDVIEFQAMWMPYGDMNSANTPRREIVTYGSDAPRVTAVQKGVKQEDFPTVITADGNQAELTIQGGRSLISVTVTGLTDYRWPRIFRKESTGWIPLLQARVGDLDGVQVFTEPGGTYGAIFLVASNDTPQDLRVTVGEPITPRPRIKVSAAPLDPSAPQHHAAAIQAPWMDTPILLRYPETIIANGLEFIDHVSPGMEARNDSAKLAGQWNADTDGTLSFKWDLSPSNAGGRLSPNEDDVDLEIWYENNSKDTVSINTQFCPILKGTIFEFDGASLDRVFLYINGEWKPLSATDRGAADPDLCHYPNAKGPEVGPLPAPWGLSKDKADADVIAVKSKDGKHIFAIAWPDPSTFLTNAKIPCVHADPTWPACPSGRRAHVRGKVYLMEGGLDDLLARVQRENIR